MTEAPTANSPQFLSLPSSTALRLDVGQRTHCLMPECMEMKEKDTWDGQLSASSHVMSSIREPLNHTPGVKKRGRNQLAQLILWFRASFHLGSSQWKTNLSSLIREWFPIWKCLSHMNLPIF